MIKKIFILFAILLILIISAVSASEEIDIKNPVNKVYTSRDVKFDFSSNVRGDFYLVRSFDSQNGIILCKNALSCKKLIKADEGENHWWIKFTRYGQVEFSDEIEFIVNSVSPKILKAEVSPFRSGYTNGQNLYVNYSGNLLKEIDLNYQVDNDKVESVSRDDCPDGQRKTCSFDADLSEFENQKIEMWFTIKDSKRNIVSQKERVLVDTTAPEINNLDYYVTGSEIHFLMDIEEKNFKEVIYKDSSDCYSNGEKDGTLCQSLNHGVCIANKHICSGDHNIKVIAIDKAGNEQEQEICVTVDS